MLDGDEEEITKKTIQLIDNEILLKNLYSVYEKFIVIYQNNQYYSREVLFKKDFEEIDINRDEHNYAVENYQNSLIMDTGF
jgi:hypothetical protein